VTETPILFLIFNRPDTSERVFEAIRKAKPTRLYVAADGPREGNENDLLNCPKTRAVVKVDWDCEVKLLFREQNLGCKQAVSQAITWFFEQEEQGIILEDDCLPHPSFFPYCETLLEYYKNEDRVMLISGDNFQNGKVIGDNSYYFSRYNHIWGWASWRRAWQHYDVDMKSFPEMKKQEFLNAIFPNKKVQDFWMQKFETSYNKQINTWDYQWTYCVFKEKGISILPNTNLISNIGFGDNSTHTANINKRLANLPITEISFPLTHPAKIEINHKADMYTFTHIFKPSFFKKILTYLNIQ